MSELGRLVAARFLDGRVLKGWTVDFLPNREHFHIQEEDRSAPTRVSTEKLKALFFIKTLEGNPDHEERKVFDERPGIEKKVWVEFTDGEELAGWSMSFGYPKGGFHIFPTDEESNMEKAYIFRAAVKRMLQGDAAEEASRAYLTRPPAAVTVGSLSPMSWGDDSGPRR